MQLPANRFITWVHGALGVKQTGKRLALHPSHLATFELCAGLLRLGQFQYRRSDIHDGQQLIVDRTGTLHAWVVDHSWHPNATFGREPFPHFVRSRASLSPVAALGDERSFSAVVFKTVIAVLANEIRKWHLRCRHVAAVRTVVGHENDVGVIQLSRFTQVIDHSADMKVHALDHRGINRHLPGSFLLLICRQLVPVLADPMEVL